MTVGGQGIDGDLATGDWLGESCRHGRAASPCGAYPWWGVVGVGRAGDTSSHERERTAR
ncbi:Protein of unknown function [Micromonospora lupini str. Lupac 08]|uniref:Uncharacterized protein n=1 Tax=Micromonospora lupini str. Lupac 08 TaxID=1150864 RepID=I0L7A3_9ACTN|nr:Protein of unknown function [Micromonospora lupini str. Lupac 08]